MPFTIGVDDVVRIVGDVAIDHDTCYDVHRDILVLQLLADSPVWFLTTHGDGQRQGFCHAVLTHNGDALLVVTNINIW